MGQRSVAVLIAEAAIKGNKQITGFFFKGMNIVLNILPVRVNKGQTKRACYELYPVFMDKQ